MTGDTEDVFDRLVERYDVWYDSTIWRAALAQEFDALRPLLADVPLDSRHLGGHVDHDGDVSDLRRDRLR